MLISAAAASVIMIAACGSDTSTSRPQTTTTTHVGAEPLSGRQLQQLVVAAPAPFVKQPDAILKTGLMEVGNPNSGEIGIVFATTPQLVAAGFQRGWETFYRAPDGAIIDVNVFDFSASTGPQSIVRRYLALSQPGYSRSPIEGVSGAIAEVGRSPQGLAATATAFAHGHFLAVILTGGPPGSHDYPALLRQLAQEQLRRLG
jgi:hypothetical protein